MLQDAECGAEGQTVEEGIAQVVVTWAVPALVADFLAYAYSIQYSPFSAFYRQLSRFLTPI
jgi:hypothetical protein